MNDPLAHLLATTARPPVFPPNSRYYGVPIATHTGPDGRPIPYVLRRVVPAPAQHETLREHLVQAGERADTIAAAELGDPELAWRLADAAGAMRLEEVERPGQSVRVPLPAGIPGAAPNP